MAEFHEVLHHFINLCFMQQLEGFSCFSWSGQETDSVFIISRSSASVFCAVSGKKCCPELQFQEIACEIYNIIITTRHVPLINYFLKLFIAFLTIHNFTKTYLWNVSGGFQFHNVPFKKTKQNKCFSFFFLIDGTHIFLEMNQNHHKLYNTGGKKSSRCKMIYYFFSDYFVNNKTRWVKDDGPDGSEIITEQNLQYKNKHVVIWEVEKDPALLLLVIIDGL